MPAFFLRRSMVLITCCFALLSGCGDKATIPVEAGMGLQPVLPPPHSTLIPTVNIAPAHGWAGHSKPLATAGFNVSAYASGLAHPRWLYVLPNGDVLVAETDAPTHPGDTGGIIGWITEWIMHRAGSNHPSANRITLLRDADGDGVAETRSTFLGGLNSPLGMALVGSDLYIANTDAVMRYHYELGEMQIRTPGVKVTDLPAGPINYHWTKNLIASPDGRHLYVTVGSNSNVGEHGMREEEKRACILEIDTGTGQSRIYASGLRNPVGMAWHPQTKALWVAVNERDELGSDLVPDYMTTVQEGGFYGWPYSYFGQHVDERVQPSRPDLVDKAIMPDYALGAHTASLGLAFYDARLFPRRYFGGAFIGQHGSWNRNPRSGYKVVFVPFVSGRPADMPEDVLIGFVNGDGEAQGRPVGVAIDKEGALLVADDVGNTVWRVIPDTP